MVVSTESYVSSLEHVIGSTSKPIVLWYLRWHLLSSYMPHLSQDFQLLGFEFSKAVYGVQAPPPRWQQCIARTNAYVGFSLAKLFLQKHFNAEARDAATKMVKH